MIIEKPTFKEVVKVTTMNLPDFGLEFNAQRVGPTTFKGLREADYGQGFRLPTTPELVSLVYASLENKDYGTASNVVKTLKDYWISGNTGVLYVPKGMYVQDNPEIVDGKILMDEKTLRDKLSSKEDKGIVYSDDKSVRFTPYDFQRESQTSLDLAKNRGVIALVNGEKNAEMLAKASQHYKLNPYFYALEKVKNPEIRVSGLDSGGFVGGLHVDADGVQGFDVSCSFGVRAKRETK